MKIKAKINKTFLSIFFYTLYKNSKNDRLKYTFLSSFVSTNFYFAHLIVLLSTWILVRG